MSWIIVPQCTNLCMLMVSSRLAFRRQQLPLVSGRQFQITRSYQSIDPRIYHSLSYGWFHIILARYIVDLLWLTQTLSSYWHSITILIRMPQQLSHCCFKIFIEIQFKLIMFLFTSKVRASDPCSKAWELIWTQSFVFLFRKSSVQYWTVTFFCGKKQDNEFQLVFVIWWHWKYMLLFIGICGFENKISPGANTAKDDIWRQCKTMYSNSNRVFYCQRLNVT